MFGAQGAHHGVFYFGLSTVLGMRPIFILQCNVHCLHQIIGSTCTSPLREETYFTKSPVHSVYGVHSVHCVHSVYSPTLPTAGREETSFHSAVQTDVHTAQYMHGANTVQTRAHKLARCPTICCGWLQSVPCSEETYFNPALHSAHSPICRVWLESVSPAVRRPIILTGRAPQETNQPSILPLSATIIIITTIIIISSSSSRLAQVVGNPHKPT